MKPLLFFSLLLGAGYAQNTDVGLLFGIGQPIAQVTLLPNVVVTSSASAHGQLNFAFQLKETKSGRLYLELPLLFGSHQQASLLTGASIGVSTASKGTVYFTPGIRWNLPVHSRISLYGAAGGGVAGSGRDLSIVTGTQVTASQRISLDLAGEFGGGIDVRLSRLMSLRAEVRDFVSRIGVDGSSGHNHVIYGFGVGFHW